MVRPTVNASVWKTTCRIIRSTARTGISLTADAHSYRSFQELCVRQLFSLELYASHAANELCRVERLRWYGGNVVGGFDTSDENGFDNTGRAVKKNGKSTFRFIRYFLLLIIKLFYYSFLKKSCLTL